MNLTTEQIKAILGGAPDGAIAITIRGHGDDKYNEHVYIDEKRHVFEGDKITYTRSCSPTHMLSDLREILELRQEVEWLKQSHDDVINAFDCGNDDDLQQAVGRMVDQLLEQRDV